MSDLAALAPRTARLGRRHVHLPICGSTNDEAARLAREGAAEGLVVTADAQRGGRGRLGRAWHSPAGENLYASVLLRPALPPWAVPPLTLLAGGVAAEVLATRGLAPRLKWPNDLLLPTADGPRKVAGILTEMATDRDGVRHVVLGIGLNVNTVSFPGELSARATSLRLAAGATIDRGELLARLLEGLEPAYLRFLSDGPADAVARWRAFGGLPQRCRIERDGALLEGTAIDLDDEGALLVRDDLGHTHRVLSGELA